MAALLSMNPDVELVGQAENGMQAVEMIGSILPDVVLLDIVMPALDGLETLPKLLEIKPDTRVLMLTSFADPEKVYQAIKLGAQGYMLKDVGFKQLSDVIKNVFLGQSFIDPSIAFKVIQEIKNPNQMMYTPDPLTNRELEVLQLIARGKSNQEIALDLGVHERTVAKYVSNVLSKLHVANRTQAALYAVGRGMGKNSAEDEE